MNRLVRWYGRTPEYLSLVLVASLLLLFFLALLYVLRWLNLVPAGEALYSTAFCVSVAMLVPIGAIYWSILGKINSQRRRRRRALEGPELNIHPSLSPRYPFHH
jgi:hypothetical protein